MKALAMLFVAALSIGALSAQTTKPKPKPAPTKVHCPIMTKNAVDIATATKNKLYADYKGRRYFFCCGGCPATFSANPDKYKKAESIPTPKK